MAETLNTKEQSYNAKYYSAKIKSNPEFYEKERKRICEYIHNRYFSDEEYRQKILQHKKERYQLIRIERLEKEKIENPAKYLKRENRILKKIEIEKEIENKILKKFGIIP